MRSQAARELAQIARQKNKPKPKEKTPSDYRGIQIKDINEYLRFMAVSRSRGEDMQHLVDLLENQCSCEDSQLRKSQECDHLSAGYYRLGKAFVALIKQEAK